MDVLLLNPCEAHHGGADHEDALHGGADAADPDAVEPEAPHDEASCPERHFPQLTVRSGDIAEWQLGGALHGCGSHHFDLTGRTVFAGDESRGAVQLPEPPTDEFDVDPFGLMTHVSFNDGIIHMNRVLADGRGRIDQAILDAAPAAGRMVVTRVRLPAGTLTALAPLDRSARQKVAWTIGSQNLKTLAEMAMFVPDDADDMRINLMPKKAKSEGSNEQTDFVTLKQKRHVTLWITDEPFRQDRSKEPQNPEHFHHYYTLLPHAVSNPLRLAGGAAAQVLPEYLPKMDKASFNIDNPLCPPCTMETHDPLP
jgi:hypothetical protein